MKVKKSEPSCMKCARLGYSCNGITPRHGASCDNFSKTERYTEYIKIGK